MAVAEVTASTRMVSAATTAGSTGGATGSGICSFSVVVLQAVNNTTAADINIVFISYIFIVLVIIFSETVSECNFINAYKAPIPVQRHYNYRPLQYILS